MSDFNPLSDFRNSLLEASNCEAHPQLQITTSIKEAQYWWDAIKKCGKEARTEHLRWLALNDLYFLLRHIMNAEYIEHEWFFARCAEVQAAPDNHLDFWSRGGGKSTVITFALNIQEILRNPNITIGIFSYIRPIAKQFLLQIMVEFENNQLLKDIFPDVLYQDPKKESPKWSQDEGIIVRRTSNAREATVEAWGMTDNMPTGKHFQLLSYDDVINERSVTTSEMMEKVVRAWELSLNLGSGQGALRFRLAGTFYADGDVHHTMMERGFGIPRIRPIIVDDKSLLLSNERLALIKQSMSESTFAMQILLNPKLADRERGFKAEWLKHWKIGSPPAVKSLNRYIFVDPGGKGEESTSYTAFVIVGLGSDKHIYILDMVKDRFGLVRRMEKLFELHHQYEPLNVYYERYSMQADVEAIREKMTHDNYRFNIIEVGAASGLQLSKDKRIEKLQPDFKSGKIILPPFHLLKYKMHDGREIDVVDNFVSREYGVWPYSREKDLLDAMARIHDPLANLIYPRAWGTPIAGSAWGKGPSADGGSWMSN